MTGESDAFVVPESECQACTGGPDSGRGHTMRGDCAGAQPRPENTDRPAASPPNPNLAGYACFPALDKVCGNCHRCDTPENTDPTPASDDGAAL